MDERSALRSELIPHFSTRILLISSSEGILTIPKPSIYLSDIYISSLKKYGRSKFRHII
ncbi:hypothetical protein HYU92_05110 [Candidatus Curtissbacteria bacterium]|nr:hypothetical protein [Candidatus Curtissbacteria bacterium]